MGFVAELFDAIAGLKRLVRTGWRERGVPEPESVAAHSYGVAVLTLLLAEQRRDAGDDVDVLKAVRMALLHDLPEHATGDLTPAQRRSLFGGESAKSSQRAAERRSLERLLSTAPAAVGARWREDWEGYAAGDSAEAALVGQADKLDCLLQAVRYRREAGVGQLAEFRRLVDALTDPALRGLVETLWDEKGGGVSA